MSHSRRGAGPARPAPPEQHLAVAPEIVPLSTEGLNVSVQLGRRRLRFAEAIQLANDVAALLGGAEVATALLQASGSGQSPVTDLLPVILDRVAGADWLLWLNYLFDGHRPVEPGAAAPRSTPLPVLYYAPLGLGDGAPTHWAPVVEALRDQIFPQPFEALSVALRLLQEGLGPFGESAPSLGRDG